MKYLSTMFATALPLALIGSMAAADQIDFLCYSEVNECDLLREIMRGYEEETGHTVNMSVVAYTIIRDQLQNTLQTASAPDIARVTDLGGLNPYYLDLTPYVDREFWEKNYGATLPWFRRPSGDDGIYGWMDTFTVTGPFINVNMFEDAGVDIPGTDAVGTGATWDEWIAALTQVQDTLGVRAGLVIDRTAHRIAGPAFSYGAKFFDEAGVPILVDEGFKRFAEHFVAWHKSGLMPVEGWPAGSGTQYRNAAPLFLAGEAAMHFAGSWAINNYDANITDFDWRAVRAPCGPGGCGSMPGGSALVAFAGTDVPEAAAGLINYMAQDAQAEKFARLSRNITANQGLQIRGVDYGDVPARVAQALQTFAANAAAAAETTPQAYVLQGYPKNFVIYGVVPDYLTKVITGEMTLDEAYDAIDADIAAQIAE